MSYFQSHLRFMHRFQERGSGNQVMMAYPLRLLLGNGSS